MPPSAAKPTSSNHFEATYEAPFAGINNVKAPSDIAVNELVDCTNITIQSDRLTVAQMQLVRANVVNFGTILYPTAPIGNEYIVSMFKCNGFMCCVDQYLNTYILADNSTLGQLGFVQDQPSPFGSTASYFTINVIGAIVLIGVPQNAVGGSTPTVYLYQPSIEIQVATTYAVGIYVGELLGYAIQLNTDQPSDDPGVNNNRFNWSAPFEYTTWDPSISRDAGFDVISDSPEQLTGFSGHGSVGYIYRPNGLTQVAVTGIAIQPFDLAPVTQGQAGIGCKYGKTLIQYAGIDFFVGESGVYNFSTGFKNISEKVWRGIYNSIVAGSINNYTGIVSIYVVSGFYPYSGNAGYYNQFVPALCAVVGNNNTSNLNPLPYYLLVVPALTTRTVIHTSFQDTQIFTWLYDLATQSWYKLAIPSIFAFLNTNYPLVGDNYTNCSALVETALFNAAYALWDPVNSCYIPSLNHLSDEPCIILRISYNKQSTGGTTFVFSVPLFINTSGVLDATTTTTNPIVPVPFNITFRQEQLKLRRQVTINTVVIKCAGVGTIIPTITGLVSPTGGKGVQILSVQFTPIVIAGIGADIECTYMSSGVFTGENPQLQLNSSGFDGYISKAMMTGTYADGDLG